MSRGDVIGLIEAAYRMELDESAWLTGLAEAAGPLIADGLGTAISIYRQRDGQTGITNVAFAHGLDPEWMTRFYLRQGEPVSPLGRAPPRFDTWFHRTHGSVLGIPGLDQIAPAIAEFGGARDFFGINGRDPTGFGVWIGAPLRKKARFSDEQLTIFTRISAHLASAYRLRRLFAAGGGAIDPEAVLRPDGALEQAAAGAREAAARQELRRGVVDLDKARSAAGRRDSLMATRRWKGLTSARWTLLDQFDHDGKQFILAYRNDVVPTEPNELSAREWQVLAFAALGHPNKVVAYELGVSAATVRVLMHRAAQKLGVRRRSEAIARFLAMRPKIPTE